MSAEPYKCEECAVDGTFDRAGKFPEKDALEKQELEKEATYGVAWRCPKCNAVSLDLCPLGPIEPKKGMCLNCGETPKDRGEACPGCGMPHEEMIDFLHLREASTKTLEKAESAFDRGLYRHGFAIIDALLQEDDSNAELWASKATQYQILRLNKAAARCYKRSIAIDAKPLIEIALACALSDDGDNESAIGIYDGLISKLESESKSESESESKSKSNNEVLAIAHANRGNVHVALGKVDLAKTDYEAAIAREPERVTHYQNYILLLARKKQWADALEVATRGLDTVKAADDRIPLLIEKARTNNELEQAEAGLAAADELLEASPDHPRGLYQRAWSLGLVGRLDEAASALEKLLEIEPDSKDGAKALAKIEAARAQSKKPWWKFWG